MSKVESLYSLLVERNRDGERELPDRARARVAANGLRQVSANALQSSGDHTVNASTVLPWLFHALGVPPALTGLLVPIREAGSMLPQALLTPLILRVRRRKRVYVTGALIQALAVAVMAGVAALGQGMAAGVLILVALTVFSLGRCLCSITSKDVQGRTLPKGERGQINGLATMASGLVAITLGLGIRYFGGDDLAVGPLVGLLAGGSALWVAVAVVYVGIREPVEQVEHTRSSRDGGARDWFVQTWSLLRQDRDFRRFVSVRGLLLVSALSPPFVVTLSVQAGVDGLSGLGGYVIASGLAALLGGRVFGRLADKSSKRLMTLGAGLASAVILALVGVVSLSDFSGATTAGFLVFIAAYFTLTLTHTGVRVGRKTYVVDMAEGDRRTTYVAVSNSAMGFILLIVGAISSALAIFGVVWALLFLAVMGLVGVFASTRLPDVSHG